ncbi:MAG: NAD(P)-dependent oxidoreductase [Rhodobacteraceae bacterium]|nr:NAD(P)-dependent oxidoreductase [Paracoccaceae bacterium]
MTTLITGATGRVGRELVTVRKARGDRIRALVLPGDPGLAALKVEDVEVVEGSLADRGAVSEAVAGVDRVAHLAAAMLWEPSADRELFEQNIAGTFHLLDEIVQQGCKLERFFLASSDEVYPSLKAGYLPIDEPHPLNPYSFYGLTKETNERFSFYYHRAHGIPATVARFALIARSEEILRPDGWSGRFMFVAPMRDLFTALNRPESVAAIDAACHTEPASTLLLALDENGKPYEFHMCDVKDVVAGIDLMLNHPAAIGQVFNLSGPAPFSYRTAVEALHEATDLPFIEVRIPGAPIRIAHDISKARSSLGYAPERDIRRIIADALAGG